MVTMKHNITREDGTLESFDVEVPAEITNEDTIRVQAVDALANLRAYVALAAPTSAQTTAAVKLLCRVAISLIRLQLGRLDATD